MAPRRAGESGPGRPEALADAGVGDGRRGAGCSMPKRCLARPRSACPAASALLIVARCHSPPGSRGAARRLGEARRPGSGRGVVLVVVAGAGQREASGHGQARASWGIALQPCSAAMAQSASPAPRPQASRSSSASRDRDRRHGRSAPGPPGCRGRAGSRPDILVIQENGAVRTTSYLSLSSSSRRRRCARDWRVPTTAPGILARRRFTTPACSSFGQTARTARC